jgi:hypothetical protein
VVHETLRKLLQDGVFWSAFHGTSLKGKNNLRWLFLYKKFVWFLSRTCDWSNRTYVWKNFKCMYLNILLWFLDFRPN